MRRGRGWETGDRQGDKENVPNGLSLSPCLSLSLSGLNTAMHEILVNYEPVNPTTWAYLSSLLMIAVYFKFNRFFSIRNLDLVGLIALAPALLMVQYGRQHAGSELVSHAGYIWLFVVSGLIMLRLLLDALLVRRPLLEPNLSAGGLTFLGISLFVFLIANVVAGKPDWAAVAGSERAAELRGREASANELNSLRTHGPGFPLIFLLPQITTQSMLGANAQQATVVTNDAQATTEVSLVHVVTAQAMAILSQLAIVIGLAVALPLAALAIALLRRRGGGNRA